MDLSGIFKEGCVEIGAKPADKKAALDAIGELAAKAGGLTGISKADLVAALQEREELGSTGFEHGIAIPHCTSDNVHEFAVGIVTAPDGVEYESIDGQPTKLFVFIIGPAEDRSKHISILATISRVFRIPGAIEELMVEKDPATLRELFLRYSRDEVDTQAPEEACIFHVLVNSEERFYDILQIFAAIEGGSATVVETKSPEELLFKIPLFASFWSDETQGFSRMIVAVVKKAFANDTIRQINDVCGGLDKKSGVSVVAQDVFYAAGSLE